MRLPCAVALLALSAPLCAAQSSSWRAHLDPSRLTVGTDSFTVLVRGTAAGWQRLIRAHEGSDSAQGRFPAATTGGPRWVLSDEITLQGVTQRSNVLLSPALVEHGLRQRGQMGPMRMEIVLDRRGDRMVGTALTPSGGPTAVPFDAPVRDDVIDDNALTVVLPAIVWRDSLSITIPVLSSGKGTMESYTATVTGRGATTVPAGTFDTWRITLASARYSVRAEVTTSAPYRVVRMAPAGSPMDAQLVR